MSEESRRGDADRAFADQRVGEALLDAAAAWREWCFRRVDSIHPDVGERGRVRHSMDCIPPPDPWLAYEPRQRRHTKFARVQGHVIVPLVFISKGPMRELDAVDSSGQPMPLLGIGENVQLAVAMLECALRRQGVEPSEELRETLYVIAGPAISGVPDPRAVAEALVEGRRWSDGEVFWEHDIDPEVQRSIREFADSFLLCGLLPAEQAGRRQVLKLAFHWRVEPDAHESSLAGRFSKPMRRLGAALRVVARSIELPMNAPSDARSYHLEFQTPAELDCGELRLPDAESTPQTAAMVDGTGQPVAHVHAHYDVPPRESARAKLVTPRRGPWTHAFLAALTAALFFGLGALLPGGMGALQTSEAADALLLAVAAVVIARAAGRRESALAAWSLGPLRFTLFAHSAVLSVWAAAVALGLEDPLFRSAWNVCAVVSGAWVLIMALAPGIARVLGAEKARLT